ncbi:MAG: flippase [archaeon]
MTSIEKGTFYLFGSRFIFFLSGYVLLFVLGRFLLDPVEFGIFGVVFSIVSLANTVLLYGIQQAVSKFVSETPSKAKVILRQALKLQFFFSIAVFLSLFLSADFLAFVLNDPSIGPYLRIAAFIPLFQPFFSAILGYLNGLKKFKEQAIFTNFYRILHAAFPIALALIGFSLFGVFAGLALSSLAALIMGLIFIGSGKPGFFSKKKLLFFAAPIIIYLLQQNAFLSIDLLFLKALAGQNSSLLAGYYTVAQTLARLPFELAVTLSIVLFPLVSETVYSRKKEKSAFYIRNAYRYSFLAVAPFAAMFFYTSAELIALVYGSAYIAGSAALSILSVAFVFMTIFVISETIITAKGNPKAAVGLAFLALIADALLLYFLIPLNGLEGAATASLFSMLFGALISTAFVFIHFRRFPCKSIAKICIACIPVILISFFVHASGFFLIVEYALLSLVFLAALFLLGEVKETDLQRVIKMVI